MADLGPGRAISLCGVGLAAALAGCSGGGGAPSTPTVQTTAPPQPSPSPSPSASPVLALIRDDAALFRLVTRDDPFGAYAPFPNAAEFTTGRLDGSEAHRPVVRVSLNAIASGALQSGRLPSGTRFPDGSVIFKRVLDSAGSSANLYAVMRKETAGPLSGSDWQWAEYRPDGSVAFSISSRGSVCIGCHLRQQGPQNDLVRTFERQ